MLNWWERKALPLSCYPRKLPNFHRRTLNWAKMKKWETSSSTEINHETCKHLIVLFSWKAGALHCKHVLSHANLSSCAPSFFSGHKSLLFVVRSGSIHVFWVLYYIIKRLIYVSMRDWSSYCMCMWLTYEPDPVRLEAVFFFLVFLSCCLWLMRPRTYH